MPTETYTPVPRRSCLNDDRRTPLVKGPGTSVLLEHGWNRRNRILRPEEGKSLISFNIFKKFFYVNGHFWIKTKILFIILDELTRENVAAM